MIFKIISGGQTGADEGGLEVAKSLGLLTGGTMPNGFRTERGNRPEFASLYGMTEHESPEYAPRTGRNVFDSCGTMRFAADFNSAGEKLTLNKCRALGRPVFDVPMHNEPDMARAVEWVIKNAVRTLNVAGNRESTHPGIKRFTMSYLERLIKKLAEL